VKIIVFAGPQSILAKLKALLQTPTDFKVFIDTTNAFLSNLY